MMVADVVAAALEQRDRHRHLQRIADERQIALEELILQRLGAGGDDHLATGEERGHEVSESLAGSGARFGEQLAARFDGERDGLGHRELLRTKSIRREVAGEHTLGAEYRVQIGIGSAQIGTSFEKARTSRATRPSLA